MADETLLNSVKMTYAEVKVRWANLQHEPLEILGGKSLAQVCTHASVGPNLLCGLIQRPIRHTALSRDRRAIQDQEFLERNCLDINIRLQYGP